MIPFYSAPGVASNRGRQINLVDGIQGVASPGVASINIPTDRRAHAINLQCTAVNYSGGTALTTTVLTGGGNGALTVTYTSTNGQPNALTIVAAGSGYAVNDTFSVNDPTGTGAVFKVTTVSGSTVTAAAYNAGTGTASPVSPAALISLVKQNVNAIALRDIAPLYTVMIQQANGFNSALGELVLLYTEPWRNVLRGNTANSWDLVGQGTMQLQLFINPGWLLPGIVGTIEFDNQRNVMRNAQGAITGPNLEPITHHLYTFNIAGGLNTITTLPINYRFARIWLLGSTPGNLTNLEVLADGNKWIEGTPAQVLQRYKDNGFRFGQADYTNQNQTAAKPLGFNPLNYFDAACIFDVDERYQRGLACASSLSLRVTSAIAQTLNVIVEALPGAYAA